MDGNQVLEKLRRAEELVRIYRANLVSSEPALSAREAAYELVRVATELHSATYPPGAARGVVKA